MARTMEFQSESGGSITLRRLTFGEARKMHEMIETVYMADTPSAAIYSEEFDKLMKTVTTKAGYEAVQELDFDEAWRLWEEYCEFARFGPFFTEAAESQAKRQAEIVDRQMAGAAERMKVMKTYGLVPDDFSLETFAQPPTTLKPDAGSPLSRLMSAAGESGLLSKGASETSKTPRSTTSTPASTGGSRKK